MKIEILPIKKEEYLKIPKNELNGFINFSYSDKLRVIYYGDKLLGLICLSPAFGHLSVDIMVLPAYRHKGVATYVLNELIAHGDEFSNYERFICLCSPKNIASNKLMQKLKWPSDTNYDEDMLNEGGEYFYIYYHDNPYYQKLTRK